VRLPAPQELTFAPAFTVLRAAKACSVWSPAVSSSATRVQQHMSFATVARVARAVLAGCGAFGVGYSVLFSAGAMQPHMKSSSNFSCTGRAEARR